MKEKAAVDRRGAVVDACLTALGAALIAVCAFIAVPAGAVPVTLQTFAVCAFAGAAGAKRGCAAVGVYLLLGLAGVPVFSGFRAGPGALFGPTGGYLFGFLATALIVGFAAKRRRSFPALAAAMAAGLLADYAVGSLWYAAVCLRGAEAVSPGAILTACVMPFLLPDAVKLVCAALLVRALRGRFADG